MYINHKNARDIYNINCSKTINSFINALKHSDMAGVVVVPIRITLDDFEFDKFKSFKFELLFDINSNYITVASRVGNKFEGEELEFISSHASCWRDGVDRYLRNYFQKIVYFVENNIEYNFSVHFSHIMGVKIFNDFRLKVIDEGNFKVHVEKLN